MYKKIDEVLADSLEKGDLFEDEVEGHVVVVEVTDNGDFIDLKVRDTFEDFVNVSYGPDVKIELLMEVDDDEA